MRRQAETALWAPGESSRSKSSVVRSVRTDWGNGLLLLLTHSDFVEDADARLFDHVIDNFFQILSLLKDLELTIGAGAVPEHRLDVIDLFARAELIDDVIDERKILRHQIT